MSKMGPYLCKMIENLVHIYKKSPQRITILKGSSTLVFWNHFYDHIKRYSEICQLAKSEAFNRILNTPLQNIQGYLLLNYY